MSKRLLLQLPLFLAVFTTTTFLPSAEAIFCPPAAWAASDFGRDGRSGTSGRDGRSGRSGENQTVHANGTPVNLDLSGQDGEDGDEGDDGENAYCGRQPRHTNHDLNAANGGNGGRGGNGGSGGNGGNLTVYYRSLEDLKQIAVVARGGEGGRSGRGGSGGTGCDCRDRTWKIERCTGTPGSSNYSCKSRRYSCQDGRDGSNGSDGRDGSQGRLGTLTVINRQQPLANDVPSKTVAIADLSSQTFSLSKNKWVTRAGALALLASGSVMADEYREFVERIEGTFQLVWNERQPISSFANETATFTLKDDRRVEISFPEDVWVDSAASQDGNVTKLVVNHAVRKSDVTKLSISDLVRSGETANLNLVDLAGKSEIVSTQFRIKLRTQTGDRFGGFSDYRTRYQGTLPPELITRDYNRFILALSKLPISAEYLNSGTDVEIELTAIRSFAGRTAEQTINWQGRIR